MYDNGHVPLSSLVHVGGNIWLPPGTLARWNWAVAQGKAKYGVTLRITGQGRSEWNTWNGYRPIGSQKAYRNAYGMLAAYPGTSSHGGTYRGQEVFAVDVDNWAEMGWPRFVALMRLAGLTTDFVSPREQWHVGDFNNPWAVPSFASGGGGSHINPPAPAPTPAPEAVKEIKDMDKAVIIHYAAGGDRAWALIGATVPGGVRSTTQLATVNRWGRIYGPSIACPSKQEWQATIDEAKALAASWLAQQKAIRS